MCCNAIEALESRFQVHTRVAQKPKYWTQKNRDFQGVPVTEIMGTLNVQGFCMTPPSKDGHFSNPCAPQQ